jgi:hypothetical protein
MEATIEVSNLRKCVGATVALDGTTFTVAPGEVTGFVGLDAPDAGSALIGGQRYASLRHPLSYVGSLLDASALQPSRSTRHHSGQLKHHALTALPELAGRKEARDEQLLRPRTRPARALASASHEDDTMNETAGGRRRWCRARPRWTGVLAVTAGLVLLTAACGGSRGAVSSPSASTTSASVTSRLAYVQCVRARGVPTYPDPQSNGQEPPGTKQLFVNNPRFRTASDACRHLLPNGGQPTQTPQAGAMTQAGAVKLAGCMRTHGYPAFPDPTIDSVGQPVFNVQAAGIAGHSPHLLATIGKCVSLYHLTGLPQASN